MLFHQQYMDRTMGMLQNRILQRLLKWYALYGEFPPADAWVWSWFPDGLKWKEGAARYGAKAVEVLTANFANDGM